MKTTIATKLLGLCALLLSIFLPAADLNAQISNPYPISNSLNCPVRVRYEIFRQPNNCGVVCAANSIVIPPGATVNIPVPPAPCGCRIRVCIVDVNGIGVPPICGTWPPAAPPVCAPSPIAACAGATGQICIDVQQTGTKIFGM